MKFKIGERREGESNATAAIKSMLAYLGSLAERGYPTRGIEVICDESNNSAEDIAMGLIHIDLVAHDADGVAFLQELERRRIEDDVLP